ncbi:phage/plasmid primase, P4 family [Sabulilitoribacter arenilitoris]|uniref:Phage/plasmid primase, P4 family n=1 Tax=Wocania arenilitoris TaxID=2044858 RepID=A0AAE3ER98_9FLAO|nr:phage/plasmid primase, P4 family [Wocania arenilitoris]MCF7569478.1 phage/plasmid primase, P4 family [Wocania arenilitoris]
MHDKKNLKKLIKNDVLKLKEGFQSLEKTTDDILKELTDSIGQIDFKILAFPDIENLKQQIEDLKPFVYNEDGSINKANKTEYDQYNKLNKQLSSYKLTKNHYLVLCIEQLLKIAKVNNWGLCKKNGFIYLYNGCYWSEIDKESFQSFLGNVALKMGVEKFKCKIHTFKDELFKQFMSDAYLPTPKANKRSVLINLLNGTYEITPSKRELRGFKRTDFLTHQLPFEYDSEATAPLFGKYLDEVLPNKDKQKVFAEYCGYIFIKPSVLKLEKMLILYGTGANGKSVFFDILNALLGTQNFSSYSLQDLTNDNGYYRAQIGNKLVNYASEINGKLETDIFKQMASGEPISVRLPYGEPFILNEYAKLIFNCNDLPKDVEHTNAYFRRFLIIGFDVTIPENKQDKELSNKIINNELSGVFNWILQGLDRLLSQKNFSKCEAIENARSDYEKHSDSVKMFIEDFEYKTSTEYTPISDLYNQYKAYCIEDGFHKVNKSNFMKRLRHFKVLVERKSIGNVAFIKTDNKFLSNGNF